MSLRDMVTGSDACTTNEGAGPSNAFAGLANTLLGTSSKDQERLKEIPGFHGLPGTSEARFTPQRPEDAALAAANGDIVQMPGLYDRFRGTRDAAQMRPHLEGPSNWHDEFAEMQRSTPQDHNRQAGVGPYLQAFLQAAKGQPQMHPSRHQQLNLSLGDQCQIRDRSTILARHLFGERGDEAADEQVFRLLQSLHIDPRSLPNQASQQGWDGIFANGKTHGPGFSPAHDMAMQNRARNLDGTAVDRWADQFADLNLQEGKGRHRLNINQEDDWAFEYGRENGRGDNQWTEEYLKEHPEVLADESTSAQVNAFLNTADNKADALEQTRALRDTMASSQDPKFRQSKFLQFVSKMSRGEIILEGNQAKEVPAAATGNQWADDFATENDVREFHNGIADPMQAPGPNGAPSSWAEEFQGGRNAAPGWADQFHQEMHPPNAWADQFATEHSTDQWAEDFAEQFAAGPRDLAQDLGAGDQEYVMASENPFLSDLNSFSKGKELFREGLLSEARLALEAEVQRQPGNVEAWRLLGTVHAENDNDQQAIAALNKALLASPGNAEVLLSLGVSYTNELDQRRAITYLMEWLKLQPHQSRAASIQLPNDGREKLRVVVDIFRSAAQMNRSSADAHIALGVLYNLSRDYDGAVEAFRQALQARSTDYSLWNKLGATLANSGRSSEAIDAYQKALNLKPNYMRAWVNMGISQANIGEYEASIRFYGRALTLNPQAAPVWSYLRTSVTCSGHDELLRAVDDEDLEAITAAMPL